MSWYSGIMNTVIYNILQYLFSYLKTITRLVLHQYSFRFKCFPSMLEWLWSWHRLRLRLRRIWTWTISRCRINKFWHRIVITFQMMTMTQCTSVMVIINIGLARARRTIIKLIWIEKLIRRGHRMIQLGHIG